MMCVNVVVSLCDYHAKVISLHGIIKYSVSVSVSVSDHKKRISSPISSTLQFLQIMILSWDIRLTIDLNWNSMITQPKF